MKVEYFSLCDKVSNPGVWKKISATVNAFCDLGHDSNLCAVNARGLKGHVRLLSYVLRSKADVLIIRNTMYSMWPMFFLFLYHRALGRRIIIDIPTPLVAAQREIIIYRKSVLECVLKLFIIYGSFPWVLIPANRVIQCGQESKYFMTLVKSKTELIGNGVSTADILRIKREYFSAEINCLNIVAVGALAPWHGYERMIYGLARYYGRDEVSCDVKFTIVGNGEVLGVWKNLARTLDIESQVLFVGSKFGSELDEIFEDSHIAVSSLGLHKIGLASASTLKSREYLARGLPIVCVDDIDFGDWPRFAFKCQNNTSAIDVESIVNWYTYEIAKQVLPEQIRNFAIENLDIRVKASKIID